MNIADMPYLMDRRDGGYSNDYTIKVYEHIPTGSNYLIEKRNFVGSFQSMLNFATELMHRVSNMPSHAIAFNQDTGEEHQIHEDGSYTITRSRFDEGGEVEAGENKEMLENQTNNLEHHIKELKEVLKNVEDVEPWVIAKAQRCVTDLMDITHYLEGDVKAEKAEAEEYADGGEVKWQEAEYGDNALVVSENKMGVIIKPYGRKFHLKFVDGSEKTYDASELKFFKDMDDFDRGGKVEEEMKDIAYYTKLFHKYRFDSDAAASNGEDGKSMRLLDKAEGYRDEANKLIKEYNKTNKTNFTFQDFDRDGSLRIGISSGLKVPTEYTNPVAEEGRYKYVVEVKYPYNKQSFITNFSTSEKDRDPSYQAALQVIKDAQKNDDFKEGHIMFDFYIKGLGRSYTTVFHTDKKKMAMGGKVKFADKVASVKASLLKRKKVPKAVQKDYGKTFSPAEAEDSAKRIVGAMTAKERLQARIKKSKK